MGRFVFASVVTLSLLASFVAGIVILALIYLGELDIGLAIALTVAINFLLWLIGPFFTDLINRWFHGMKFLTREELKTMAPQTEEIIEKVAAEHKFRFPKIGYIADKNPTAFTYGSSRFNARIVITEGILHYLSPEEARAVVAHELGHIVNRDFIVMMVASTLLQILYEIYARLSRRNSDEKGPGAYIAFGAYVLYIIGIYLVMYLSRTRESLADAFATRYSAPANLGNALVKIAYGIVAADDTDASKRLLAATRHLGIMDVKNAKHTGVVSYITHSDPNVVADAMVFDTANPWAFLAELNSTHPLTGRRMKHLSKIAQSLGQTFPYDIDAAVARANIDSGKMFGGFWKDFGALLLPYILAGLSLVLLPWTWAPGVFGAGLILLLLYKFPQTPPQTTTVLEEMRNPYASPIRGKPVMLEGSVVGRGSPGYIFGEDMMFQDKTGLIFLDYTSLFGFIGNFFFALSKLKQLFGAPSQTIGWFYRSMGSHLKLKTLQTQQELVRSHPMLWQTIIPLGFIIFTIYATRTFPPEYLFL